MAFLLTHEVDLLWKVLIFCKPGFRFIDPVYVKERLTAFIDVVERRDSLLGRHLNHRLWAHPQIVAWLKSSLPQVAVVDVEMSTRTRGFALELIEHLGASHPVLYLLDGLPPSTAPNSGHSKLDVREAFEQLTAQCLRHMKLQDLAGFAHESLQSFKNTGSIEDCISLFHLVCAKMRKISVVLDRSTFSHRWEDGIEYWQEKIQTVASEIFRGQQPYCLK